MMNRQKSVDVAFLMHDERDDYILFRTPPTPRRRLIDTSPPTPRKPLLANDFNNGSPKTGQQSARRAPKIRDINRSLSTDSPRKRERREAMRRSKTQRRTERMRSEDTKDTIVPSSVEASPAKKAPAVVNGSFQYDEFGLT
ncbi:hypothetical protein AAVH_14142 [Aphelenchoides avenae]|nr:hypothetical protein AAVH_14142 [Aphelenchus avenae]